MNVHELRGEVGVACRRGDPQRDAKRPGDLEVTIERSRRVDEDVVPLFERTLVRRNARVAADRAGGNRVRRIVGESICWLIRRWSEAESAVTVERVGLAA